VQEVGGELGLTLPEEDQDNEAGLRRQVAGGGRRVEVMP
jgi:hypothetical protein